MNPSRDLGNKAVLTGERLGEILSHTIEVQKIVSDIAGAAREQASGLGEINSGVNQLDTATQRNAAVAEAANAASSSLLQKSDGLLGNLSRFRTAGRVNVAAFKPPARRETQSAPKADWLDPLRRAASARNPRARTAPGSLTGSEAGAPGKARVQRMSRR